VWPDRRKAAGFTTCGTLTPPALRRWSIAFQSSASSYPTPPTVSRWGPSTTIYLFLINYLIRPPSRSTSKAADLASPEANTLHTGNPDSLLKVSLRWLLAAVGADQCM
jgi:hypothetical protein